MPRKESHPARELNLVAGELVTWNTPEATEKKALLDALEKTGLNVELAVGLKPKTAFRRACSKLNGSRIVRKLEELPEQTRFQFTREEKRDRFEYEFEDEVKLEKSAGRVYCSDPVKENEIQLQVDHYLTTYLGSDVSKIISRIFDSEGDVFPIKDRSGCYFVPKVHLGICDKVELFLKEIGGVLVRYTIANSEHSIKHVRTAVKDGLSRLLQEYRDAIEAYTEDTRADTVSRAIERIQAAKVKVEAYSEYLSGEREDLLLEAEALKEELIRRLEGTPEPSTA